MIGRQALKAIGVVLGPAAMLYILLSRGVIGMSPDSLFYMECCADNSSRTEDCNTGFRGSVPIVV